MTNRIILTADDGTELELFAEEETKLNGTTYLLASDSREGDAQAYILKDMSDEESPEAGFVIVDDGQELEAVAGIFREMLEDTDIE